MAGERNGRECLERRAKLARISDKMRSKLVIFDNFVQT